MSELETKVQKAATRTKKKIDNVADEIAKAEEQAKLLASKKVKPYIIAAFALGFGLGVFVATLF